MTKNLTIYYSCKGQNYVNGRIECLNIGNTEICAEYIQKSVGGDMFEIRTVDDYSKDYHTCTKEAEHDLKNNARPKLIKYLDNIDTYENVFICGPCWWGTFPMPVFSQIERLNFSGKKVMILMTHEGSGLGNSEYDLRTICKGAIFGKSIAVRGADCAKAEKDIELWAKSNLRI